MTKTLSTLSLISTTVLSSPKVLDLLQSHRFHEIIDGESIREAVYLTYQPWAAREPDHVFERGWAMLEQSHINDRKQWYLFGALQALQQEFLSVRHGALYVQLDKFGVWQQSVTSRICSLPVQAAGYAWPDDGVYMQELGPSNFLKEKEKLTWANFNLTVMTPYDPLVEDYLEREGLHETHLHLNGSTHAEICWLRALHMPEAETHKFESTWFNASTNGSAKMRELAHAINPALSPSELRRQLHAAKKLRCWLIAAATNSLPDDMLLPPDYATLANSPVEHWAAPFPGESALALSGSTTPLDELRWICKVMRQLDANPNTVLERMLHCYILLQNQYYRLLVQSEEQYGFDQFQKLTWTELREPAERDYENRFLAMHGRHRRYSRVGYLEGRFAPKGTAIDNAVLIKQMLSGYCLYLDFITTPGTAPASSSLPLNALLDALDERIKIWLPLDRRQLRLGLVAHFIKQPWNSDRPDAGPYRFYALRQDLELKAHALITTLDSWPRLRSWLRGIDAAANELHAPPEVFSTCYRLCKHAGLTRRSYHAGEDFPHLLSGLRHMLDALELLDLKDGDRIGHGTAMGILPQLWLARMPADIIVTKGDWLLDLLAVWRLLRRIGATAEAYSVESDLAALSSELFGKDVSCTALERAMGFRHLHMGYLQKAQSAAWKPLLTPLNELQHTEALRVYRARRDYKEDLALLWRWQTDKDLWKRSAVHIDVKADYLSAVVYLRLQQALMKEVAERHVLIETLPSSNVRISQYRTFSEHHSFRWMRVPGFVQEGDPSIMVTLGSDDPGIFAGDLSSEFYQLYATLRGVGLGDKEALRYLAPINERGRQYRFHDPNLG
jgi:hypothetical protein